MPKRKKASRTHGQYTAVLLEDIRGKFTLIHEAVQPIPKMKEKLDATFEEVGNLCGEMDAVKAALKILGRDMDSLKNDVGFLKQDMTVVKSELRIIKNDLRAKVDREEFEALEERVEHLEHKAAS